MRQSQPFQNSRIAHRLLNSPVNHWIKALIHLLRYTIDFAWLSHDQNEQNSERDLIVSLSSTSFSVMFSSCLSFNRTGEVFSHPVIQTMFLPACRRLLFPLLHAEKGRLRNAVVNRVPASRWQGILFRINCEIISGEK